MAEILHATFDPEARRQLKAAADELVDALWKGYSHASDLFRANPTTETWRALVRSHTCWRVAFLAEDSGAQP